ncbi:hypothetical protein HRG_001956 [Hirsutella rhossiliensis]|uniref:F-box domain-containing protein n=1 Tax=Hirsutella rhossiliensis TaxID=111463 RepID=A0A9P8N4N1_9HYPO|nr:uncharacterized protein HRG_01956 [Hirsutella rhossiliensis]KAH0966547.1 hypothetical protein HRG_01956 [Hirsutella rhossiliensis]
MSAPPSHLSSAVIPETWQYHKVDCALCGVFLTRQVPRQPVDKRSGRVDEQGVAHDFFENRNTETLWLNHVRLLGDDPASTYPYNVTLSDLAGDDDQEESSFETATGLSLKAYYRCEGHPYWVPFHEDCYELLRTYVGVPELDKEILHDALSSLSNDEDSSRTWTKLNIGYEGTDKLDAWSFVPFLSGLEHLAMSPVAIKPLDVYLAALPRLQDSHGYQYPSRVFTVRYSDPFTRLSAEVLAMIASQMDVVTLMQWRRASAMAANCHLTNTSWKIRLFKDMPFLRGLIEPGRYERQGPVDWAQVFKDLWGASKLSGKTQMHGLSNRRRIWEDQCPVLAREYEFMRAGKNVNLRALIPQLEKVSMQRSGCLVFPEPLKRSIYTPTLLNNLPELTTIEPSLMIVWTDLGTLAAIDILQNDWMESFAHRYKEDDPRCERKARCEVVKIPRNDWVTGFTFFIHHHEFRSKENVRESPEPDEEVPEDQDDESEKGQELDDPEPLPVLGDDGEEMDVGEDVDEEEAQRYDEDDEESDVIPGGQTLASCRASQLNLAPRYDYERRIVGLEVHLATGDRIRLGHETKESRMVHVDADSFVVGLSTKRRTIRGIVAHVDLIHTPMTVLNCPDISRVIDLRWADHEFDPCQLTWRPEPPPADMRLCKPVLTGDQSRDFLHGEVLILGKSEEELARITAIHASVSPLCFQVDYHDGSSRRIGAALGDHADTFSIDGQNGERIILVFVAPPAAGGWGIRIVTNRERQMSLGWPTIGHEVRFPPEILPGELLPVLSGIYLFWRTKLDAFGTPFLAGIGYMTRNHQYVEEPTGLVMAEDTAFGLDEDAGIPLIPAWAAELFPGAFDYQGL